MLNENKLNIIAQDPQPWYKEGLRFECTGCGGCCTGSPGYVWVDENEMAQIAALLDISLDLFKRRYTRQKGGRYSLLEKRTENYDCIFLKEKKCTIYKARPKQCRTFPWWVANLKTKECWENAAKTCEGITADAPLVAFEVIQENIHTP